MKISGSYDFRLDEIADVGGIRVTQVSNMGMDANNPNAFSITLAVNVPTTVASIAYTLQQSPLRLCKAREDYGNEYARHSTGKLFCDAAAAVYATINESHDLSSARHNRYQRIFQRYRYWLRCEGVQQRKSWT